MNREEAVKLLKKYNNEEFHIRHAITVEQVMKYFAKENGEDQDFWGLVGLLHDYARFEQWTDYKTYSDIKSIDHGDLAVKRLFDDNEIINFCIDKKY